jgi:hypothetical protein
VDVLSPKSWKNVPFQPQKYWKNVPFLSKNIGKMFQNGPILIGKSDKNICSLFISS